MEKRTSFFPESSKDGLLVLVGEKEERIDVADGGWFSTDRNGVRHAIKDPFRQATDSKHTLLRYLRDVPALGTVPQVCHGVVFPDLTVIEPIGLTPRQIILDGADLVDLEASLERVLRHWGQQPTRISPVAIKVIVDLLAPTTTVSGMLRTGIAQAERQLLTLTKRQVEALSMLRAVRRCVIRGGAGTGKTLLATDKARRLHAEGAKVLLVCFNVPIVSHLAASLKDAPGIQVSTFHAQCVRLGRSSNQPVPSQPDNEWFASRAADVLANTSVGSKRRRQVRCPRCRRGPGPFR